MQYCLVILILLSSVFISQVLILLLYRGLKNLVSCNYISTIYMANSNSVLYYKYLDNENLCNSFWVIFMMQVIVLLLNIFQLVENISLAYCTINVINSFPMKNKRSKKCCLYFIWFYRVWNSIHLPISTPSPPIPLRNTWDWAILCIAVSPRTYLCRLHASIKRKSKVIIINSIK